LQLFVGQFEQSVTYEDLLQAFRPYGELIDVKILAGKAVGLSHTLTGNSFSSSRFHTVDGGPAVN